MHSTLRIVTLQLLLKSVVLHMQLRCQFRIDSEVMETLLYW